MRPRAHRRTRPKKKESAHKNACTHAQARERKRQLCRQTCFTSETILFIFPVFVYWFHTENKKKRNERTNEKKGWKGRMTNSVNRVVASRAQNTKKREKNWLVNQSVRGCVCIMCVNADTHTRMRWANGSPATAHEPRLRPFIFMCCVYKIHTIFYLYV